ncbi:Os03g0113750 [Oryza sativa Japonica Group]|uniref:Os03g0113750 protein n=1 Tax=Oryza sativa subsp. japonica TaxID=39947 RepID=A0A0P0VS56_ORYSJ|nr:hypothetical protein EE612_014896 [Oryza sativa]BAS81950.1 Os03g0113750 [Oryza sativa Japonica Group]
MATASSGFTPLLGALPKISETTSCTFGTLVMPPTRRTSSTSLVVIPASFKQLLHGSLVLSIRLFTKLSNFDLVNVIFRCFAPEESAVMNGRLISVWAVDESSIFAFSAASRSLCRASLSFDRSIPSVLLNSLTKNSKRVLSKSSPPRKVSPFLYNNIPQKLHWIFLEWTHQMFLLQGQTQRSNPPCCLFHKTEQQQWVH